jgi:hypothetical protein
MTTMKSTLMTLAVVIAALPLALYAQSDLTPPSEPTPPSDLTPQSTSTQTTPASFTIAPDPTSGGMWRLNENSGELWFCLAASTPKCHLAQDSKK